MRTWPEWPRQVSFVMVLWLEPQKGEVKPEWRWRVNHVQTGERASFRRLNDVLEYVSSKSGESAPC